MTCSRPVPLDSPLLMKKRALLAALSSVALAAIAIRSSEAQDPPPDAAPGAAPEQRAPGGRSQPDGRAPGKAGQGSAGAAAVGQALITALDRDGDKVISSGEIDLAVVSLRALDKNRDGQITVQELTSSAVTEASAAGSVGRAVPGGPAGAKPAGGRQAGGRQAGGKQAGGKQAGGKQAGGKPGGAKTAAAKPAALTSAFRDMNGDGKLTVDDLPPAAKTHFAAFDLDGDGVLDALEQSKALALIQAKQGKAGSKTPAKKPGGQ